MEMGQKLSTNQQKEDQEEGLKTMDKRSLQVVPNGRKKFRIATIGQVTLAVKILTEL